MAACSTRLRFALALTAAAVLAWVTGCRPRPFDEKISARNDLGFSLWLSDHVGDLTPDDQRALTEARQQIKLAVMTDAPGLAAEDFNRSVYAEISGHTVREVLVRGIAAQADRITAEIVKLEGREENYRKLDATVLSPAAREFLEGFNARMAQRRTDLQRLEERKSLILTHP